MRNRVRSLRPALGLHLAHYVEKAGSFRQAYHLWASEVSVPLVGVSGLLSTVSLNDAAYLARSLLSGADGLPILDLLERGAG